MNNNNIIIIILLIIIFIICLIILITLLKKRLYKSFNNSAKYQWITNGTYKSNNLDDLDKNECSNYFNETNYTITDSPHRPPGCWLVLGNKLNKVLKKNPEFKGKGFGCWANINDEKKCSPEVPCVCKSK